MHRMWFTTSCRVSARWAGLLLSLVALGTEAATPVPAPPALSAKSAILMDFHTGRVLTTQEPDLRLAPASITKLMTAYTVFGELRAGKLKLEDRITVSETAWRTGGSRMFVEAGSQVPVVDLIQGMIVQSGNDATVTLAEQVAGSEQVFADLMNRNARALGMRNTHFVNSTGLPDAHHYSTARDIAKLVRALIRDYPDYYRWYSQREYEYHGIKQHNRNSLLWRDPSVDGVKTGFTDDAGYCLASSAQRGEMRLISVLLGTKNEAIRARESLALLNYGFRFYETHKIYAAGAPVTQTRIWQGAADALPLGLSQDLYLTVPRGQYPEIKASMTLNHTVRAPATRGRQYGVVNVTQGTQLLAERPLVALNDVAAGNLWQRLLDGMQLRWQ